MQSEAVNLGSRTYHHDFIVANVSQPILGADFLAQNYLAPNHRDAHLIDLNDLTIIQAHNDNSDFPTGINFVDQKTDPYYQLLDKFPRLSIPSFTPGDVKHNVRHHIPTSGHPVQSKARKLSPEKLQAAKEQFEQYVKLGIAKRAKSEWASPILVTGKKDGGHRVCGDFRRLNCQTQDDKYPVKSLNDFNADLQGRMVFSKIDFDVERLPSDTGCRGRCMQDRSYYSLWLICLPPHPLRVKKCGTRFSASHG